jgi:hypothetical protein
MKRQNGDQGRLKTFLYFVPGMLFTVLFTLAVLKIYGAEGTSQVMYLSVSGFLILLWVSVLAVCRKDLKLYMTRRPDSLQVTTDRTLLIGGLCTGAINSIMVVCVLLMTKITWFTN